MVVKSAFHYNGKLKEAYVVDKQGRKNGPYESFHESGKPNVKCTYKNDVYDGVFEKYYEDGLLQLKCRYQNGKENGPFEEYYRDGSLYKKGSFVNGVYAGPYVVYSVNGQIVEKGVFVNGEFVSDDMEKIWQEKALPRQELNAKLAAVSVQMAPTDLRQAVKRALVAEYRQNDGR